MDERMADVGQAEDRAENERPGTTMVLTAEGWEAAEFIDPETDWQLQDDGSFLSPDGTMRTWLLTGPEPA
jgi:hypothetical protein